MLTGEKDAGRALCTSTVVALQKITDKMYSGIEPELDKFDGAALNLDVQNRNLCGQISKKRSWVNKTLAFFSQERI